MEQTSQTQGLAQEAYMIETIDITVPNYINGSFSDPFSHLPFLVSASHLKFWTWKGMYRENMTFFQRLRDVRRHRSKVATFPTLRGHGAVRAEDVGGVCRFVVDGWRFFSGGIVCEKKYTWLHRILYIYRYIEYIYLYTIYIYMIYIYTYLHTWNSHNISRKSYEIVMGYCKRLNLQSTLWWVDIPKIYIAILFF